MTMFSADDLNDMEVAGEMATEYTPVPEGEYQGEITKQAVRAVGEDKDRYLLEVTWRVDDDAVREETGIDTPTVRQTIWLDVNDSGLELGKGKNVQLGRLRESLGQNGPGSWRFENLIGGTGIIRVEHRQVEDRIYAEVKAVAAA